MNIVPTTFLRLFTNETNETHVVKCNLDFIASFTKVNILKYNV